MTMSGSICEETKSEFGDFSTQRDEQFLSFCRMMLSSVVSDISVKCSTSKFRILFIKKLAKTRIKLKIRCNTFKT